MNSSEEFDIVVVGAGLGGIYALHHFSQQGFKTICLEKADSIGGVWNYNRYPGARVDVDSTDYCYCFSKEIYEGWRWSERYAAQSELLDYLHYVVDKLALSDRIKLSTPMTGAQWYPEEQRYHVNAGADLQFKTRFLIMATGNLSEPRDIAIEGADSFRGRLLRSSRWPKEEVDLRGLRVAIVGTGSSGVQATPVIAEQAEHLYVFQRTAHYCVPAQNGQLNEERYAALCANPELARQEWAKSRLFGSDGAGSSLGRPLPAAAYSPAEQQARLEAQWLVGGQRMHVVFADQTTNREANTIVADFVRAKIRQTVQDAAVAEKLCPKYPIGTRRLIQDIGYYETFNRDNVTLIDAAEEAIECITPDGIRTNRGHYDLDVIVVALGFKAFVGEINQANIRNEKGETPTTHWSRGPRTLLGIMTAGFPNMFMLTGPGSPSVLANLFTENEYHVEWIAKCIRYMDERRLGSIEPEVGAQDRWTQKVTEAALPLLRLQGNDYMVHRNEDGTRAFIPFAGGVEAYVEAAESIAANGYEGFAFERQSSLAAASAD